MTAAEAARPHPKMRDRESVAQTFVQHCVHWCAIRFVM